MAGNLLDGTPDPNAQPQTGLLGFDPTTYALAQAAAAMGAASAPSRLPITMGSVIGAGAGGLAQGQLEGAKAQQAARLQNAQADYYGAETKNLGLQGQVLQSQLGSQKSFDGMMNQILQRGGGTGAALSAAAGGAPTPSTSSNTSPIPGNSDFVRGLYGKLRAMGYSPQVAAGVLGNAAIESSFNPANDSGDGGTSMGLWQWHDPSRVAGLMKYAQATGKSWTDPDVQVGYMDQELRQMAPEIFDAKTAGDAAKIFQDKFETPNPKTANTAGRVGMANNILMWHGGSGNAPTMQVADAGPAAAVSMTDASPAAPSASASPPASGGAGFDPNAWAAKNGIPIGLDKTGQLVPQDKMGRPVYNAPGFQYAPGAQTAQTQGPINELTNPKLSAQIDAAPASGAPIPLDGPAPSAAPTAAAPTAAADPTTRMTPGDPLFDQWAKLQASGNPVSWPDFAKRNAAFFPPKPTAAQTPAAAPGMAAAIQGSPMPGAGANAAAGAPQAQPASAAPGALPAPAPPASATPLAAPVPRTVTPEDLAKLEGFAAGAGPQAQAKAKVIRDYAMPQPGFYRGVDGKLYPETGGDKDPAYQGQVAAATSKAKAPYEHHSLRPGALDIDGNGNVTGAAPVMLNATDNQGNVTPTFVTPPLPGATAPPAAVSTGVQTKIGPGREEGLKSGAKDDQELMNNYRSMYLSNQGTEQDIQHAMDALQYVQSGAGTGITSDVAKWLRAVGVEPTQAGITDPRQVEIVQKAAARTLAGAVKSVVGNNRPALGEFDYLKPASINEDLEPESQKVLAASLLSTMNWQDKLYGNMQAHRNATGTAEGFDVAAFGKANPMPTEYQRAWESIPQLKGEQPLPQNAGMAQPRGPSASSATPGMLGDGQIAVGPNGHKIINRGGTLYDMQTNQPLQPSAPQAVR